MNVCEQNLVWAPVLNHTSIGEGSELSIEDLRRVINVEQWLTHLAVMALLNNRETSLNNGNNDDYFIYRGTRDPRFIILFFDLDTILGEGDTSSSPDDSIYGAVNLPVFDAFLHHPEIEPVYHRILLGLVETVFSEIEFDAQLEQTVDANGSTDAVGTASRDDSAQRQACHVGSEHAGDGDGWVLSGSKIPVPAAELADCVLVPASVEGADVGLFLLDPRAEGVRLVGLETPTGQPASLLQLDRVRVGPDAVLGSIAAGRAILEWLLLRATAAQCAMGVGICQAALEMTTEYIKERKQFGQPIAMFQAVGHRAADAFIDVQGIQLTTLQACWRVAAGLPATREVALAKYWVAEAGARVVAAAQHLHGGIGVDRDYPVHRFYLYAKQLELDLGGSTDQLRRIGRILAEMPFDTAV